MGYPGVRRQRARCRPSPKSRHFQKAVTPAALSRRGLN